MPSPTTDANASSAKRSDRAAAIRIVALGGLAGRLEPCGCRSRPLGGLDRLATLLETLSADGVPTLTLAAGSTFYEGTTSARGAETQDQLEAETAAAILGALGIDVVSAGVADLSRGRAGLDQLSTRGGFPIVASGVRFAVDNGLHRAPETFAMLESGTWHIGVLGLVSDERESDGFRVTDSLDTTASAYVAKLRQRGAHRVVVLLEGNLADARRVASRADIDVIVLSDPESREPVVLTRETVSIVKPRPHGEDVVVIELDESGLVDARLVAVDERLPRDSEVSEVLRRHARKVNEHNRSALSARRPPAVRDGAVGYVGSKTCAACHVQQYTWWARSSHGRAYLTLVERDKEYDLDCVGCHVTGYGKPGGSTVTHVEGLRSVGCESCHGPGGAHVENPQPPHRFVHAEVERRICLECHDREHSDRFDYSSALETLRVRGHGGG